VLDAEKFVAQGVHFFFSGVEQVGKLAAGARFVAARDPRLARQPVVGPGGDRRGRRAGLFKQWQGQPAILGAERPQQVHRVQGRVAAFGGKAQRGLEAFLELVGEFVGCHGKHAAGLRAVLCHSRPA
jgi:hypothetical protein